MVENNTEIMATALWLISRLRATKARTGHGRRGCLRQPRSGDLSTNLRVLCDNYNPPFGLVADDA